MERTHYLLRELGGRAKELPGELNPAGKILIVDDGNADYCSPLAKLLPDCRFIFESCPQTAKKRFISSPVDVVILGCDLDLLPAFKSWRPSVSVIFITAQGSEELAVRAFRHGAIDYFRKPIVLEDLELSIRAVLEIRKKSRQSSHPMSANGLHKALRYMEASFHASIKLEDAACEAGMSVSCFERYLKNQTGMTFTTYINSMRVARAKELLRTTSSTMLQIALTCGFGNQSNFNRVFRKITGTSPGAYRKDCPARG